MTFIQSGASLHCFIFLLSVIGFKIFSLFGHLVEMDTYRFGSGSGGPLVAIRIRQSDADPTTEARSTTQLKIILGHLLSVLFAQLMSS
jgi:hypothetical protein